MKGMLSMTLYNSHAYMTPDEQGTETSQLTVITWHALLTISRPDLQTIFNMFTKCLECFDSLKGVISNSSFNI